MTTSQTRQVDLRAAALALAADGRYAEAIASATAYNRSCPDEEIERLRKLLARDKQV